MHTNMTTDMSKYSFRFPVGSSLLLFARGMGSIWRAQDAGLWPQCFDSPVYTRLTCLARKIRT
eukprot:6257663-Amphidinium_carterae.1